MPCRMKNPVSISTFCPGGEVTWIIRNPAIYSQPFRINQSKAFTPGTATPCADWPGALTMIPSPAPGAVNSQGEFTATVDGGISGGLEPGDITKYNALPWQTDFNECATQQIDITYDEFNQTYPASNGDPFPQNIQMIWWWPTHRPLCVNAKIGDSWPQVAWTRGIPQTLTGDQMMVQAWSALGFIVKASDAQVKAGVPLFHEAERNKVLISDDSDCEGS